MKRSKKIQLTLLMGASGGLAGCGDSDESALLFENVQECTYFGIEEQTCEVEYQDALASHLQEAPRYATEQLCASDFGYNRCENNSGIWQPIMAGFMVALVAEAVAEAIDEAGDALKKKRKHKGAFLGGRYYSGAKPLYRSRDDFFNYRNSNNDFVASTNNRGTTLVKSSKIRYTGKTKSVTRKRGGFGRSASRSSWGG